MGKCKLNEYYNENNTSRCDIEHIDLSHSIKNINKQLLINVILFYACLIESIELYKCFTDLISKQDFLLEQHNCIQENRCIAKT